jgi:broad specificity phosphatase PhoE
MDLYLVRHGQPDWTPGRIARNNPVLTDLGHAQAERVAQWLSTLDDVDRLWVSSLTRAMETSEPIIRSLSPDREVHDWLQEIGNPPQWEGSPGEEIDRWFEKANLRSIEELWEGLGPGGESFLDFHTRVGDGVVETLASCGIRPMDTGGPRLWSVDDPTKRVVVVAHAGTNAVILGHLLGLEPVPWEWERFRQPHTGVSRLTMIRIAEGWAFSLRQLGGVSHLDPDMNTV